jgi:ABC-2 type transport system permease protein
MTAITVHHRAGYLPATLAVARRTLLKFARTPALIVVGTIQGAMFLLIFRYVFGGAISSGALRYVDFLIPGFVTTGVMFSGMNAATGIAEDIEGGLFDRFRSLPMPRSAAMAGRVLADTVMVAWGTAITAAIGFLVGFRLHASLGSAVAAFGLCVLFGFIFCWVFMTIGLFAGSAQAAQGMSLLVFPFTFVSSAYVPVRSMPSWMRPIASHQPITIMVDAIRSLTEGRGATALLGHHAAYYVTASLLWCVGLTVVFAPIAVYRYRRG